MTMPQGNGPTRMTPKDTFYKVGTGIHRAIFNLSKGRFFGKAFGMPLVELVGRALAPDHLGFRGLRPLPEADPPADSGDHPRTPWVATRRLGAPGLHRRGSRHLGE
jgi:hypothetical protein